MLENTVIDSSFFRIRYFYYDLSKCSLFNTPLLISLLNHNLQAVNVNVTITFLKRFVDGLMT